MADDNEIFGDRHQEEVEQREQYGKEQALKDQQFRKDIEDVLRYASGERVFTEILSRAGIFHQTFSAEDKDVTAFREGKRALGLEILSMITQSVSRDKVCDILVAKELK